MFPPLPCLESLKASQEECVHCSTRAHTSYECDAYRQVVKRALEIKSNNPPNVGDDAIESRPGAGPMISTKRVPEKDSWYRCRKVQNNIPRQGFTSRNTCFGQLNVVFIPKEDKMEMRVEYPKPIDRPQVSGAQDSKGSWRYDDKAWFAGWKFTVPKSSHMKAQCPGCV